MEARPVCDEPITLVLRRGGALNAPISVARCLCRAGLSLPSAHAVINRLAEIGLAVCQISEAADILALADGLAAMNVRTYRRRQLDPILIGEVRARHGLSQREFAGIIGVDVDTLQNWEQGGNRPDAAALNLVAAFDADPEVIERAVFDRLG